MQRKKKNSKMKMNERAHAESENCQVEITALNRSRWADPIEPPLVHQAVCYRTKRIMQCAITTTTSRKCLLELTEQDLVAVPGGTFEYSTMKWEYTSKTRRVRPRVNELGAAPLGHLL